MERVAKYDIKHSNTDIATERKEANKKFKHFSDKTNRVCGS